MTAIVGLKHEGIVFIGGDSAGVAGYDLTVRADTKVFRREGFVFGFTTSFRMGQLLRFKLKLPRHHPDDDVYEFMCVAFIDAVRKCLKDGGWASKENENEKGGTFIVGFKGRLFVIDSDYQVGEPVDSFAAVGCGQSYALGSLISTGDRKPRDRVRLALEAAERFSAGVCGPFIIQKSTRAK